MKVRRQGSNERGQIHEADHSDRMEDLSYRQEKKGKKMEKK